MATDVTIGVLMSSGPEVVTDACVGVDRVRFVGMQGPDDLAPHVDGLDALVVSNDFYTPEVARLVFAAPRLRWLQSSSTGYEHLSALGAPRHLAVTEPGSVYSDIVAEHAVALLLALARGVLQMERNRLERRWDLPGVAATMVSLKGRNLLAVGFGGIGQETAKRVRPFGMSVTAMVRRPPSPEAAKLADRLVYREQLHEALALADAVVLGIPLVADTEKLIGAPEFAAMKPSAFLINMARGPVVDEQALIAALRSGRIAGAALDVVEKEPLSPDSPLWGMDRVIISPHLSAYGDGHGSRRFGAMIRENVERFVAGRVLLNPIAGYRDEAAPPK
jgi:phosphoglycerate dehydrogenase-like enzyme